MEENAQKRKREEEDEHSDIEGIIKEMPFQSQKRAGQQVKRQKRQGQAGTDQTVDLEQHRSNQTGKELQIDVCSGTKSIAEKRKETKRHKKAKEEEKAAKRQAKKASKEQAFALAEDSRENPGLDHLSDEDGGGAAYGDVDPIDVSGMADGFDNDPQSTATPSLSPLSPPFDVSIVQSAPSSNSSITAPTVTEGPEADMPSGEPLKHKPNPEELKARLQQRIEALRAARKADGLDGKPARNRQELMEARRRKEEQRKAHKKEVKQKAREEELRKENVNLSRGSPLLSPASFSNSAPSPSQDTTSTNNFSFGRVTFEDGQRLDANLTKLLDSQKRKGPQDPFTALKAAENKQARIRGLDDGKRTDIEEKDLWLIARKRAHGERVRDDSSLLKKTLKRKDKAKKKSEKEWNERIEGVQKSQAMRQKKREENLQKRKNEKGSKGGKKKGVKGATKSKSKARPGFEGSFRAKAPGASGGGKKK